MDLPTLLRPAVQQLRHAPRRLRMLGLLMGFVLVVLVGERVFRAPLINPTDVRVFHHAGRVFFTGGDPYGAEFAAWMTGDPTRAAYAYPPASFVVLLPLLPLPQSYATSLWLVASVACLASLAFLVKSPLPKHFWFLPLAYYPSLYALNNTQWAPIQLGLFGLSLYLFRHKPWLAGCIVPFIVVKPTVGLGLALFALLVCGANRRWWAGVIVGAIIGYLLPFVIQADWPLRWLASVQRYADPADQQSLVSVTNFWEGQACLALNLALIVWSLYSRRWRTLGCLLVVLSLLATPHRAPYDYAVLCVPFLLLPARWRFVAAGGIMVSWIFPWTFLQLQWASPLQLVALIFLPTLLACCLIERNGSIEQSQPANMQVPLQKRLG